MPRSTLFPYTTLFRSPRNPQRNPKPKAAEVSISKLKEASLRRSLEIDSRNFSRSEERFSRNAEIYTLSLHDALPISQESAAKSEAQSRRSLHFEAERGVVEAQFGNRFAQFLEIGRAVQQECRDLHSFPTRRSSDLPGIRSEIRSPKPPKSPFRS